MSSILNSRTRKDARDFPQKAPFNVRAGKRFLLDDPPRRRRHGCRVAGTRRHHVGVMKELLAELNSNGRPKAAAS